MGNNKSNPILDKQVTETLNDIVIRLENFKKEINNNNNDFDSSINYLKNINVKKQFIDILKSIGECDIEPQIKCNLGIVFLEIIAETKTNKYSINFYPCKECACVVYKEIKHIDNITNFDNNDNFYIKKISDYF